MQNSFLSALGLTWSSSELTASFSTQERKYYCLLASCLGLNALSEFDSHFQPLLQPNCNSSSLLYNSRHL